VERSLDGSENSARDDISLDFGKPDLHLIEPTRIGRSVVEANRGIGLQELENLLGFMRAQVVDDEVNFSTLGLAGHDLAKKTNKLGTGDVAGAGVERRIQGEGAMSKIFKAMPFGPAGRKRQNGVKPVEGLDSAFLIHAENCRVQRWPKIQANDICRLLFKLRIISVHATVLMNAKAGRNAFDISGKGISPFKLGDTIKVICFEKGEVP
jgi:hypothetical protein